MTFKQENETSPLPLWTKVLPWIVLIVTSIACVFVIQKGCIDNSSMNADPKGALSSAVVYPSQGLKDLEKALENSTTADREFTLDGISFVQASALVDPTSKPALDQLTILLGKYNTVHVRLEGYCTQQQNARANLKVSHQRASSVANYLKAKGISANRLRTVGRGESKRRTSSALTQGMSQNELIGLIVESR